MKRYDRELTVGPMRHNTDWSTISSSELAQLFSVTVLHMSPDCKTYSSLALSCHRRFFTNGFLGESDDAHKANGHAVKLFDALRARILVPDSPLVFTIENPEGTFQHHPMVQAVCRPTKEGGCGGTLLRLSFCAFGARVRKNTVFVTNSPTLIALAANDQFYCHCSGKCPFNKHMSHHSITIRNRLVGRNNKLITTGKATCEVTPFPRLLCQFVAKCVDADVAKLRCEMVTCDNAQCLFKKGHRAMCSHAMVKCGAQRRLAALPVCGNCE